VRCDNAPTLSRVEGESTAQRPSGVGALSGIAGKKPCFQAVSIADSKTDRAQPQGFCRRPSRSRLGKGRTDGSGSRVTFRLLGPCSFTLMRASEDGQNSDMGEGTRSKRKKQKGPLVSPLISPCAKGEDRPPRTRIRNAGGREDPVLRRPYDPD